MANHASAIKKNRADEKKRRRNQAHTSRLRTQVKKLRQTIESGDAAAARGMLDDTLGLVDRSAKLGVIHDNTASRTKSRLQRAVGKLAASK